jgi:hypothetical protein
MKPISFFKQTVIYAKDQLEYNPLPAYVTDDGVATSCWTLSVVERLRVLFGANIYWSQRTFNHPLQAVRASLDFDE